MLPSSADRRLALYRWVGYSLAAAGFLVWLGLVWVGQPLQAGLWYGVVVAMAGVVLGYAVGFDRGRDATEPPAPGDR